MNRFCGHQQNNSAKTLRTNRNCVNNDNMNDCFSNVCLICLLTWNFFLQSVFLDISSIMKKWKWEGQKDNRNVTGRSWAEMNGDISNKWFNSDLLCWGSTGLMQLYCGINSAVLYRSFFNCKHLNLPVKHGVQLFHV